MKIQILSGKPQHSSRALQIKLEKCLKGLMPYNIRDPNNSNPITPSNTLYDGQIYFVADF